MSSSAQSSKARQRFCKGWQNKSREELRSSGEDICPTRSVAAHKVTFADNIRCTNLWQHVGMLAKPELIARLQVGLAASGECSTCHEVFVVSQSSRPEQLSERLKQIFAEHVRGVELSKKAIS